MDTIVIGAETHFKMGSPRAYVLPMTTSLQIVRVDQGGVNERILAREAKVDYRRVEAASVKMPACFTTAEGKHRLT